MKFRPCIDLRDGRVVQIVGGSLTNCQAAPITNFETERPASEFARIYSEDGLTGGHVIRLGPGNDAAALSALEAYPGGLQVGGGITPDNAKNFLESGASHVIVTSYVFQEGRIETGRLESLVSAVGKNHLVLDLSCRKRDESYWVVTNRWQTFTAVEIKLDTLEDLAESCDEFLVHGVDVEGKQRGIEEPLVEMLGAWSPVPVTYAGGAKSINDLDRVKVLGKARVDLTIGSALDLFGGNVPYREVVRWHQDQ